MGLNEWLTLAGIVLSPIVAVLITLWVDERRKDRDAKMGVVRVLLATSHMPSDPNYSTAINVSRLTFAKCPHVRAAFKEYHRAINNVPANSPEALQFQNTSIQTAQIKLLSAMLAEIGIDASEADLAAERYAAAGFIARDNLFLDSLRAHIRTADALERQLTQLAPQAAAAPPQDG